MWNQKFMIFIPDLVQIQSQFPIGILISFVSLACRIKSRSSKKPTYITIHPIYTGYLTKQA